MKLILIVLIVLMVLGYGIYRQLGIQEFGASPSAEDGRAWQNLPNFDARTGTFTNIVSGNLREGMEVWLLLQAYIFGQQVRFPTEHFPAVAPDFDQLLRKDDVPLKWIWLGHSTLYLNVQGTRVLVDPVFGSASPLSFMVKRFQKPVAPLADLPQPDVIVLSHDHYDHLDAATMRFLAKSAARFLVPLGIGAKLRGWGVDKSRIEELNWHENTSFQGVTFTAVPAQHFSGRGLFDANRTLWAGWVLATEGLKIFYSGDTGYADHFKDIGLRYGPLDLAFLECGQYNKMWRYVHMLPEEVMQAAKDLKAANISPVHWGMFNLSLHDWFEPIERISQLAENEKIPIWHPRLGELVPFRGSPPSERWWQTHPDFMRQAKDLRAPR